MTAEQYGPIAILAVWEDGNAESFYLVTNMSDLDAALVLSAILVVVSFAVLVALRQVVGRRLDASA